MLISYHYVEYFMLVCGDTTKNCPTIYLLTQGPIFLIFYVALLQNMTSHYVARNVLRG